VSAVENSDESSVQFEGRSNVIEIKKLLSTKTKDKRIPGLWLKLVP